MFDVNKLREKELLEQEENVKTLSKALANAANHRTILQSKIRQLQSTSANQKKENQTGLPNFKTKLLLSYSKRSSITL